MTATSDRLRAIKERFAQRRAAQAAARPERLQRRTEAHARRLDSKRGWESDPKNRGGSGG